MEKRIIKISLVNLVLIAILVIGVIVGSIIAISKINNNKKEEANNVASSFLYVKS